MAGFFDANGVIEPISRFQNSAALPAGIFRSPYNVDLTDVGQFAFNEKRVKIFQGLLWFRRRLYEAGVEHGFQWINGSFLEDCEGTRGRPPGDIDVVTFYRLREGLTQRDMSELAPELMNHELTKQIYHVDHAPIELTSKLPEKLVELGAYWSSLWSHQRGTYRWKGFYQVVLDRQVDADYFCSEKG